MIRYSAASTDEEISEYNIKEEHPENNKGIKVLEISLGGEVVKVCTVQGLKKCSAYC